MAKRRKIGDNWCRKRRGKWVVIPIEWLGHDRWRCRRRWYDSLSYAPRRVQLYFSIRRAVKKETEEQVLDFFRDKLRLEERGSNED